MQDQPAAAPNVEVHVLYRAVVPQEGCGEQATVAPVGEEQFDEGSEDGDDVTKHDKHKTEPKNQEEILVNDVRR